MSEATPKTAGASFAIGPRFAVSWRTYAQLVRLPNVFTALADICLGALVTGAWFDRWQVLLPLLPASGCLYSGGMVWNDVFDVEQDRRERPFRPLPSGRISRRHAMLFGTVLLGLGVGCAFLAGAMASSGFAWASPAFALALAAAILLYDGWLKYTWAGPLGMGTCRCLNVLLGLSAVEPERRPWGLHLAFVVGVYIVGVTWFARTEARRSSQTALAGAALVMLGGLMLALLVPARLPPDTGSPLFPYLLVGLGFLIGIPVCQAIALPTPPRVQAAVKRSLMGLVVLDATLATAFIGAAGLLILLLLPPALYLGRWLYST